MPRIDHHINRHIDRLKERPRDERLAVAGMIALGVIAVLLVGWAIAFLANLRGFAANNSFNNVATSTVQLFQYDQTSSQ